MSVFGKTFAGVALSAMPGGQWLALAWQGVKVVFKLIAALIRAVWEAVEITIVKPVVLTIVVIALGFGVYCGIAWDAHLVADARADRDTKVAAAELQVAELQHQIDTLETGLGETDDADKRKAKLAQEARQSAEARAQAEAAARDPASPPLRLRNDGPVERAPAPARRHQVRRRCQAPWLQSLLGYCP